MFAKSWTTGRSKKRDSAPYPGIRGSVRPPETQAATITATTHSRQDHLDSYLDDEILGKSTRKVSSDDTTYDTVFSTISGDTLIVRVHFPALTFTPGASLRAPEMKLTGVKATHPWIDGIGKVTGYDPISSDKAFRESKMLLGAAVKVVVREFQLNPPTVIEFGPELKAIQPKQKPAPPAPARRQSSFANGQASCSTTSSSSTPPPDYFSTFNGSGNAGSGVYVPPQQAAPPSSSVLLPPVPSEFPALEDMEREDLDELLNDELAFMAFCNNLPFTQQLDALVSEKSKEAERLATENLSRQAELQELHVSTKRLHEKLQTVVKECQELERQQDSLSETPDARQLLKELTHAKRQAYDETEKMANDWLRRDDCAETMDQFIETFLEKRKIHHLRAAKIQILTQQEHSMTNGRY